MAAREREEFISQMLEKIDTLSIEQIVGKYIDLKPRGAHFMGLCPFHRDTHIGSFIVTPQKKIWKCFACGDNYGGDGVKFVMLYNNCSYLEAAFDIALAFGLISSIEYEKYSKKRKSDNEFSQKIQEKREKAIKKAIQPDKKASKEIIALAYNVIKEKNPLSEEHKQMLLIERYLSKERLSDYFTMPTTSYRKNLVIKTLKDRYPDIPDTEWAIVPGFFIDKKTLKLSLTTVKGLGILIKDLNGNPIGIQVRRDKIDEGMGRYVWFASSFAKNDQEKYIGGASSGSPKDVLFPATPKNTICITEGKFKSEKLRENGNISISVQGVTAWEGVPEIISNIRKSKRIGNNVFFFFDADMWGKKPIFDQSLKLYTKLKEMIPGLNIKYAVWSINDGKGVDDCINNGNLSKIRFLDPLIVAEIEQKVYSTILNFYKIKDIRELPKGKEEEFQGCLQRGCEKYLLA